MTITAKHLDTKGHTAPVYGVRIDGQQRGLVSIIKGQPKKGSVTRIARRIAGAKAEAGQVALIELGIAAAIRHAIAA